MQFSRNNLLITDHFFFFDDDDDDTTQNVGFLICLFKVPSSLYLVSQEIGNCNNVVSLVYAVFVIPLWYSKKMRSQKLLWNYAR